MATEKQSTIFGGPTKRFFVSMLTRDIELNDAILDLVDNCVDGATRQLKGRSGRADAYVGFETRLSLSSKSFDIEDNCGGIPKDAVEDAFMLGRPKVDKDKNIPTIGVYGIGMKRAIFKMGEDALVESHASDGAFAVEYTKEWMDPDNNQWDLPIKEISNKRAKKGVTICVTKLRSEIASHFGNLSFINTLKTKIAEHFGYLIQKGFNIFVNGEKIAQQTLQLYTSSPKNKNGIRPYDFELDHNGVHVRVTVGFFRQLARIEEIDEAAERPELEHAGISVICNDRLVLLNDKSMKTGWGDGGVPKYHPQFRSIAGFIVFSTNEPEKLPISTTKRDLDLGQNIYLQARQYCMEGLRECTAFTNKWKGMEEDTTAMFEGSARKDVRTEVRLASTHGTSLRGNPKGKKFSPSLPVPENRNPMRRVSFVRRESDIKKVSEHLFSENDRPPGEVGGECFDRFLTKA